MNNKRKKLILIAVMIVSLIGMTLTVFCAKNSMSSNYSGRTQKQIEQNIDRNSDASSEYEDTLDDSASGSNKDKSKNTTKEDSSIEEDSASKGDATTGATEKSSKSQQSQSQAQGQRPESQSTESQAVEKVGYQQVAKESQGRRHHSKGLDAGYILVLAVFAGTFSLSLFFLIMSKKDPKFYNNNKKLLAYALASVALMAGLTFGATKLSEGLAKTSTATSSTKIESEESSTTTLDESNVVEAGSIDLSQQDNNVTIKESGTYTFSGKFTHSIIVDAEGKDVDIVLNGVDISNDSTAAIIGLNANKINITLADGTENTLKDGGESDYDGCIFSYAELNFDGTGKLVVKGEQTEGEGITTKSQNITFNNGTYEITSNDDGINTGSDGGTITINDGTFYIDASGDGIDSNKDAIINGGTLFVMGSDKGGDSAIDTDGGYQINGGTVVALGSDMVESPVTSSKQKTMVFNLESTVSKDTVVSLMNGDSTVISFKATKSFNTAVISSSDIKDGSYTLYTGGSNSGTLTDGIYSGGKYTKGTQVKISDTETFKVSDTVNVFGSSKA